MARLQLERRFRQLQPLEQFPFYGTIRDSKRIEKKWKRKKQKDYDALARKTGFSVQTYQNIEKRQREKESRALQEWPPKTSIEEQQTAIKKMVRFKREKQNRKRIVQTILTSEGKFRRLLFGGASQNWSEMNELRRQKYQHILTEIIAKYAQTVSRRKGNTRKSIKLLRLNIVPELERSREFLEQTIREKKQNMDQAGEIRLRNMVSVIDGLISTLNTPIPRERALIVQPAESIRSRSTVRNVKPLTQDGGIEADRGQDWEFRKMELESRQRQLITDLRNAQKKRDELAKQIALRQIGGQTRNDPKPEQRPRQSDDAPLFGSSKGVRKWIDSKGDRHPMFVNRNLTPGRSDRTSGIRNMKPVQETDPAQSSAVESERNTPTEKTWRERTHARWLRIQNGMKRLRERMRRKTKEE
jgi:hypothetical protein